MEPRAGRALAYWDAINDVYHGLSASVRALYAGPPRWSTLRRHQVARRAHGPPGAHRSTPTPSTSRSNTLTPIPPRTSSSTPTHFFTYGENIGCRLPGAALGGALAADPPAGHSGIWPVAAGEPEASRPSRPGRTRARTSSSRAPATCGQAPQFPALPRCRRWRPVLHDGDVAARCRDRAVMGQAGFSPIRARSRRE
jgi:hypothetical protein